MIGLEMRTNDVMDKLANGYVNPDDAYTIVNNTHDVIR